MGSFPQGAQDVASAGDVDRAVQRLAAGTELAVDVEADAMHAFRARLCFVQVGTDEGVWLFDTLVPEVRAAALAPLFADPARTKFFHAAGGDLQYLAEAGVRVHGLFDTHRAATLLGWPKVGLADLAKDLVGVALAKEHQQSDFSIRPLSPEVHAYIADDVRYLCEIGRKVKDACRAADVLEEVELDCQRLADEAAARPDLSTSFRAKLPKGSMQPKLYVLAVAIADVLHQRRLFWAEAANVPFGRMLSNAAVTALAVKPPSNIKELAKAEGVRGPFAREHGEEVLGLIRGLVEKSRNDQLPAPEADGAGKDPKRRKRAEALKVFRSQRAAERKVTPSVVLPNPLVEELADAPPADLAGLAAVPYFGEKRVRLYGAALLDILHA